MSNIQNLTASLDLKQNLNIYANCKQFDNLNLILLVYDNSVQADLSNYNVRLVAMKADKIPLVQEHTDITINNNVVTIAADEQLTTTSGKTLIELQFTNNSTGQRKATFNLALMVNPSTLNVGGTISTATYTLMQQFVNELDRATDYFESVQEFQQAHPDLLELDGRVTENENSIESINTQLSEKANDTDSIRTTTSKTVTGAINELNSGKASLASPNFSGTPQISSKNIATTETATITLLNGWGNIIGDLRISRNGNQVTINAVVTGGATAANTVFASIPAGFRSGVQRYFMCDVANSTWAISRIGILINTDGSMTFDGAPSGNTRLIVNISYTI